MPGDYNGTSGSTGGGDTSTGTGTDLGGLVDDIGGLVDGLFSGDFWDFISGVGCLTSTYKMSNLKERFPQQIDKMRQLSGVDVSLTDDNVNNFLKRLYHIYSYTKNEGTKGHSCKHKYLKKFAEMAETYIDELEAMLVANGFVFSGLALATNFSQPEVVNNYGFGNPFTFHYTTYHYVASADPNPNNYGTIGGSQGTGGNNPFSPGGFVPTMQSSNVFNWAFGAGLCFMGFVWLRDSGNLKEFGINKKRKR